MAFDGATGQAHAVTDLRSDGSKGWTIDGYALSPDRSRIAVASLYGPTKEDVATHLAANRIWTFAIDGTDFRRVTPVLTNTAQGRSQFAVEIRDPVFSKDGATVFYSYGEFWYEGTKLQGASGIWSAAAAGGGVPSLFKAPNPCSLVDASVDPSTGKVAVSHSVCIPGQAQDGIYLHAANGSGAPEMLVGSDASLDVMLVTPRWVPDGSGFVFVATTPVNGKVVRGLFVFDMASRKASPIVLPEGADAAVLDGTIAPDASGIVYCLQEGDAKNLHFIDLSVAQPTDAAITKDGTSCHPVW